MRNTDFYWEDSFLDESNFKKEDVINIKNFVDGSYIENFNYDFGRKSDYKLEYYSNSSLRYVDKTNGFAITIPNNNLTIDYQLAKYGVKFISDDFYLRVSQEKNTYGQNRAGYNTYITEWLDRYINNEQYLIENNLSYYEDTIYQSYDYLDNFEVTIFSIKINNLSKYSSFYKIGIIKKKNKYDEFTLFLLKSNVNRSEDFNSILKSYKLIETKKGTSKNYLNKITPKVKSNWSSETLNYYNKLKGQNTLDFGVFSYSMSEDGADDYSLQDERINSEKIRLESENGLNHTYEIMPTYTHLRWEDDLIDFPNTLASKYAGGNGFNNLPVLQFTYQFTTNNNHVTVDNKTENYTPMFDILRGVYDEQFTKLAKDIKNYGKPILFRLNNEMNSDWTSYSGIMSLIDPEIFKQTWIHLYNIFKENEVDNCLWIFNPIHVSTPYSNWGEDLAYFPGEEYVDLIGMTSYEFNNGDEKFQSFKERYSDLYSKNNDVFGNYMVIISEFACGSGGETTGELYRNEESQANWVKDMFAEFSNRNENEYLRNIKGAVWFSCNDVNSDGKITNALALNENLIKTLSAFKEGFALLEEGK